MRTIAAEIVVLCGCCALLAGGAGAESFVPDGRVNPDDYTVLMAVDAPLPEGARRFQAGGHGKFYVEGWTRPEQVFRWDITVPADDAYAVNVLTRRQGGAPAELTVSCGTQRARGWLAAAGQAWRRQALDGVLRLPAGRQTVTLEARGTNFALTVMSLELVRPAVRERLHQAALALRADTAWLQAARYGFMVHWTSRSCPRHGPRKPYAEAVRDFDVEAFASQAQAGGAGFVVFTTSHAEMYFPAPIRALDRILPGRTTERDLVADLAAALGRRGIRLMLYYHLGAGDDSAWLRACGFWETDTARVFANWVAVVSEVGQRYGDKLAGWWFDDGAISYYYRSAPWEQLTRAAKAGNPRRLVGYNPWELPSPTEFQDFFCGEGFADPAGDGTLPEGGSGRYANGLQACATLITEGDWGHFRENAEPGRPRWTAAEMTALLAQFGARGNVPIFNLEIGQEGALAPATIAMFGQAQTQARTIKAAE